MIVLVFKQRAAGTPRGNRLDLSGLAGFRDEQMSRKQKLDGAQ